MYPDIENVCILGILGIWVFGNDSVITHKCTIFYLNLFLCLVFFKLCGEWYFHRYTTRSMGAKLRIILVQYLCSAFQHKRRIQVILRWHTEFVLFVTRQNIQDTIRNPFFIDRRLYKEWVFTKNALHMVLLILFF